MSIYAVNGKEPVAAWIPSLDTAGNGTTTLTDLTGNGYDGTLTNMDAATDWVADTDAGGVRALDFDGVNDYVATSYNAGGATALSLSFWAKQDTSNSQVTMGQQDSVTARWGVLRFSGSLLFLVANGANSRAQVTFAATAWTHWLMVFSGAETGNDRLKIYKNGAIESATYVNALPASLPSLTDTFKLGRLFSSYTNGCFDDTRIWQVALDAADAADLYASGVGRGITFGATGNPSGNLNNTLRSTRYAL